MQHSLTAPLPCSLAALGVLSVLFGAVELLLLFVGFTMFKRTWSAFHSIAHLSGLILVALAMHSHWSIDSVGAVFALCSVLPFAVESSLTVYVVRFALHRW